MHLRARVRVEATNHFILRDFLDTDPEVFGSRKFQAVLGNPPYIRHHGLGIRTKRAAKLIRDRLLPELNLQSSSWVYFLLHSCEFLEDGGRMAWLLPLSFTHARYAKPLREFLCRHFEEVTAVTLRERLFRTSGAAEGTVVLLAKSWRQAGGKFCTLNELNADNVEDVRAAIFNTDRSSKKLGASSASSYLRIQKRSHLLGEYCDFSIGIVTGDSKFFLFNADKARKHKIKSKNLKPIASKASLVRGLKVSRHELSAAFEAGAYTKIIDTSKGIDAAVDRYLRSKPQEQIINNLTFGKRALWHQPFDGKRSAAFFTGMSNRGPRLILNAGGLTCTNSLYRVTFRKKLSQSRKMSICVSLVSTFGQLSAELTGRAYAAGLLKHEPSDARSIAVLLPKGRSRVDAAFKEIDLLLRKGSFERAREAADAFLVGCGVIEQGDCDALNKMLNIRRAARRA